MSGFAIAIAKPHKTFGRNRVSKDINLYLKTGEIVGLVGNLAHMPGRKGSDQDGFLAARTFGHSRRLIASICCSKRISGPTSPRCPTVGGRLSLCLMPSW